MSEFREQEDQDRLELMEGDELRNGFEPFLARVSFNMARVNAAADGEDMSAAAGTAD